MSVRVAYYMMLGQGAVRLGVGTQVPRNCGTSPTQRAARLNGDFWTWDEDSS